MCLIQIIYYVNYLYNRLLNQILQRLLYTDSCSDSSHFSFDNIFVLLKLEHRFLGAVSIRKTVLPGMAIPMLKIRRPNGRLIFNMEIALRR